MQSEAVVSQEQAHPVLKQVIVVRADLKMSQGKVAAQVAHASVLLVEAIRDKIDREWSTFSDTQTFEWYSEWRRKLYRKIVLAVDSEDELLKVFNMALASELPVVQVRDAGLTELPPNTLTCVGIGPAPANLVDAVTGKLKLL